VVILGFGAEGIVEVLRTSSSDVLRVRVFEVAGCVVLKAGMA
jgi:hypothetical protein